MKFIFVTGGVISGVGKGVAAGDIFPLAGVCRVSIFPWSGCYWYYTQGLQCKFCGKFDGEKGRGLRVIDLISKRRSPEFWWKQNREFLKTALKYSKKKEWRRK